MHRTELQKLSSIRLREARALIAAEQWSGAYYLSGYALECGLKSCLVQKFRKSTLPDKNLVREAYTHDLTKLVSLSGLKPELDAHSKANPTFDVNWSTAKDWSEQARYSEWSEHEARDLYRAINARTHGVLQWIKGYW